jgi:anaerobic selenocysteine-containing dehydrogenase
MLFDYKAFLDGIDRKAYHEGEWQWDEDGCTVTRTYTYSAPGCHDSCGVLLYTKDDKLVKVEGDPLDPCANGRLCMRCLNLTEAANYEKRPKYPMKRAREDRGKDTWERISWDEALTMVADYLKKMDEDGIGRERIFVNHGTGRNISSWVPFLGGACLGTPNIGAIGSSGYSCYLPRTCGTAATIGDYPIVDASETHEDRYANADWVRPDVVVVWGCEPLHSNADGYLGHWLIACKQMGTKFIVIDPQLTWLAAQADYWLPLRATTDTALALAWINVITQEDLFDHDFVDRWCAYYDELKEYAKDYTPEWAAGICDIPADLIRESARFYANADKGAIQWGLAFDTQITSMYMCHAVSSLMALCGNIDKPGTHVLVRNGFDINPGYATAQLYVDEDTWAKKLTIETLGKGQPFIGMADADACGIAMESGKPYPLNKMMWIQGCNPITGAGNGANRVYDNIMRFEFVVCADPYMTPTAMACADLFLPLKMTNERDSMRVWWTPLRAMKSVNEYYEAKSDEELIVALGHKTNPELFNRRWPTVEALLDDYLTTGFNVVDADGKCYMSAGRSKTGMVEVPDVYTKYYKEHEATGDTSFMDLVKHGGYEYDPWCDTYYKYEKGMLRPDGQVGFSTPTGRIELIPFTTFKAWGISPYPKQFESVNMRKFLEDPSFREEYPFICLNGSRSFEFFHSENRQQQTMREFHPDPVVRVPTQAAEKYDIHDGDWIWIENAQGRCRQKAKVDATLNPMYIHAEHGWWYPEANPEAPGLFDSFDVNINNCTHSYETGDAGVGSPFKSVAVKIYKCTPENSKVTPGMQVTQLGGFKKWTPGKPFGDEELDSMVIDFTDK